MNTHDIIIIANTLLNPTPFGDHRGEWVQKKAPPFMPESKLSSPVTLKEHALWFGEIELHKDKIVISGWIWTGPVEKEIPLSDATTFEKWTVQEGPNFRLHFGEGNSVFGRIEKGAGLWKLELEDDERIEVRQRH